MAGLLLAFGMALMVMPTIVWPPPKFDQLVRVEGPLVSYSLYRTHERHPDLLALFKLGGHSGRFWNDALKNGSARLLSDRIGARISVMYQPDGHRRRMDGDAAKSYGLWLDGVELASARDAVSWDRFLSFIALPALGLVMMAIGYATIRKWRRQQEEPSFPGTTET